MTLDILKYTSRSPAQRGVQITAANRPDVATLVGGTIVDSVLMLPMYGDTVPAPDGTFLLEAQDGSWRPYSPDQFEPYFTPYVDGPALAGTTGLASIDSAIAAGTVVQVPVTFRKRMPSTDYAPAATIVAGTGSPIGGPRVLGVTNRTTTGCTVVVQNTGVTVIAAGAYTVSVLALAAQ